MVGIGAVVLTSTCLLGLSCYKFLHTYLICVKPLPAQVTLNGKAQDIDSDGCFILHELYGAHTINVRYRDGTSQTVVVYPRFADDNSSSLIITEHAVESHGDLRFQVVRQQ